MRTYYVFFIKKNVYEITKNKPEGLYKILENIYLLDSKELPLGMSMFEKICDCVPKKNYNKIIYNDFSSDINYFNVLNTHVINDFLNNENTKMIIKKSYILIKSNSLYPAFFKRLAHIPNLFVCDFINMDYFYLKGVVENSKCFS